MAKYTVTTACFIDTVYYNAGATVETDAKPGPHMVPFKGEGGVEDADAVAAKEAAKQEGNNPTPTDPKFIGDLINANVAGGGEDGGRPGVAQGQQTVPGLIVDDQGQVRGVGEGVGAGDRGDGSNAPKEDGPGLKVANPDPVALQPQTKGDRGKLTNKPATE